MNRQRHFPAFIVRVAIGVTCFWSHGFAGSSIPSRDACAIVLIPPADHTAEDAEIVQWQQKIAAKSDSPVFWERLGWAYIAKARRTQDAGFYTLAELTAGAWEKACGTSPDVRLLRGHVYHNLHRFREAESIARSLVEERHGPADYALLSDALMELGRLDESVAACQELANLRPGVESFTRIAHLRLLHGDLDGALQAMDEALRAVPLRDQETRCWIHSRLAAYELLKGRPAAALSQVGSALNIDAEYSPALELKGRAMYSMGRYEEASDCLRKAAESNPIPDNLWWWSGVLRRLRNDRLADEVEQRLRHFGEAVDPRTLSLFFATEGEELARAHHMAEKELLNRSDILTHDALAFALFKTGRIAEAKLEIDKALATHACDPRIALHAALIAESSGDLAQAAVQYARSRAMANALTPSEQNLLTSHRGPEVAAAP